MITRQSSNFCGDIVKTCVSYRCHHWFACSAPSHYLNQCWPIVNFTSRTNLSEILIKIQHISFIRILFKKSSAKWRPFCGGLHALPDIGVVQWSLPYHCTTPTPYSTSRPSLSHNETIGVIIQYFCTCLRNMTITIYNAGWQGQRLERDFTGDRWILRTKGQLHGKCFHLMT